MGVRAPQRIVIVDSDVSEAAEIEAALCSDIPGAQIAYRGISLSEGLGASESEACTCAVVHLDDVGIQQVSQVVTAFRERGVPVVYIAPESHTQARLAAVEAGAAAVVNDGAHPMSLSIAVMTVLDGGTWIPPDLMEAAFRSLAPVSLSGQERRALSLYASGMTLDAVAQHMEITPHTVKHYLDRVRDKYTAVGFPSRSKVDLHRIARLEGLLP